MPLSHSLSWRLCPVAALQFSRLRVTVYEMTNTRWIPYELVAVTDWSQRANTDSD